MGFCHSCNSRGCRGEAVCHEFLFCFEIGMWLRAESIKTASDQDLQHSPCPGLCPLHSLGEHEGKPWCDVGIADSQQWDLGSLLSFLL